MKSESEAVRHTPGPWQAEGWLVYGQGKKTMVQVADCTITDVDRRWNKASIAEANAIQDANARLIAAAPELLAFVERVEGSANEFEDPACDADPYYLLETILTEARELLAKATGGAQ